MVMISFNLVGYIDILRVSMAEIKEKIWSKFGNVNLAYNVYCKSF